MNVAIIQYNAGNTQSVIFALERLGISPLLTDDAEAIKAADKVIFPGQGEASTAMAHLRARGLDRLIPSLQQPFLGICLGLQLLAAHSEENDTPCLGIIPARVRRFPNDGVHKIPHMGWNNLLAPSHALFAGITEADYVYFVHSYYLEQNPHNIAGCEYIVPFSAAIAYRNFSAVQFHPEKSAAAGAKILENFLRG